MESSTAQRNPLFRNRFPLRFGWSVPFLFLFCHGLGVGFDWRPGPLGGLQTQGRDERGQAQAKDESFHAESWVPVSRLAVNRKLPLKKRAKSFVFCGPGNYTP